MTDVAERTKPAAKTAAKKAAAPAPSGVVVGVVKDPSGPYMKVEQVGPERAQELLGHNVENRIVSSVQVNELAEAMRQGMFVFDGSPLRVSHSGRLLDGQHRLLAILKSETTQTLAIWYNVSDEAQIIMDTGRRRSFGDALKLRGEKDTAVLGAIIRAAYRWDQGVRGAAVVEGTQKVSAQYPILLEYLDQHPEVREGIRPGSRVRAVTRVPMSVLGVAYFLFQRLDEDAPEDTAVFFHRLATGEELAPGNPVHTLRQQWIRMAADRDKPPTALYLAQMVRAWNAYRDGEQFWKFSIRVGGSRPSDFPEPH